jgi:pilus assembly protein Flp/PilA
VLRRYVEDQEGATAVEYGLVAAMISLVIVGIASTGGAVDQLFAIVQSLGDAMAEADEGV